MASFIDCNISSCSARMHPSTLGTERNPYMTAAYGEAELEGGVAKVTSTANVVLRGCTIANCRALVGVLLVQNSRFELSDCAFHSNDALRGAVVYYPSGDGVRQSIFQRVTMIDNCMRTNCTTVDFIPPLTWACQVRACLRAIEAVPELWRS
eukprot:2398924-Prymnesium_polylepis.3